MKKFIVEFTLTGETVVRAASEEEAHAIVKKTLEKSTSVIGEELSESSDLVHVAAKHLHTLSIIREKQETPTEQA